MVFVDCDRSSRGKGKDRRLAGDGQRYLLDKARGFGGLSAADEARLPQGDQERTVNDVK